MKTKLHSIVTSHDYPPIPYRGADWSAQFDWDRGEDDKPVGRGADEAAAVKDLILTVIDEYRDTDAIAEIINLAVAGWMGDK